MFVAKAIESGKNAWEGKAIVCWWSMTGDDCELWVHLFSVR